MISRSFLLILCLAATFAGLGGMRVVPAGPGAKSRVRPGTPVPDNYTGADFRREFAAEVRTAREKAGLSSMTTDPRLEEWLNAHDRQLSCGNLDKVIPSADIPGFRSINAAGATGNSLRELSRTLRDTLSDPATSAAENRMALLIRSTHGPSHEVIVLTGEALPELTTAGLNDGSLDAFVSQCPHCLKQSSFLRTKSGCGLLVDCPDCGLRCQFLAQDTNGRYHDATAFLLPSACPEVAPGTHPLDTMLYLWQTVVRRCRYVEDNSPGDAAADSWQTPGQTLRRGAGDCEDSALLLTDWLLTRGISARMAMGRVDGGGHAWCIARVDGTDYLLESTNRNPDMNNLPAVNPGDGYEPSTLIDRDALYVRAHPAQPFDSDYWSPAKWIKLPRAKPVRATKTAATQNQ